jgi:hypothetical protein
MKKIVLGTIALLCLCWQSWGEETVLSWDEGTAQNGTAMFLKTQ